MPEAHAHTQIQSADQYQWQHIGTGKEYEGIGARRNVPVVHFEHAHFVVLALVVEFLERVKMYKAICETFEIINIYLCCMGP